MTEIHLGYQLVTGDSVEIPLHHTVITGVTRLSGKTTTIEAMLTRMPASFAGLVFRTKRGEIAFDGATSVQAYYRPSLNDAGMLDWPYVVSLLETAMREKMRLERSFIINASKNARTLREFYDNICHSRETTKRGFDESIFTNLQAYMEIILPQLEQHPFAETLVLKPGLNVMDLGELSEEVQSLVITSCIQEIHKNMESVITVIPEAWKFLPQSRSNPVKWAGQHLVREGGASNLWLWLDSQDITRVDKDALKSVGVWIMGCQQEINEVKRVLDQLPIRTKPKPDQVMGLSVGHFWVAAEGKCREVYVQPAWLTAEQAYEVATGEKKVVNVHPPANQLAATQTARLPLTEQFGDMEREISDLKELLAVAEHERDGLLVKLDDALHARDGWLGKYDDAQDALDQVARQLVNLENDPVFQLRDALIKLLGVQPQPAAAIDPERIIQAAIDLDELAEQVSARLGVGTYLVGPVEALKHQYQIKTVDLLGEEIAAFGNRQREGFKWLIAVDHFATFKEAASALGIPTAGGSFSTFNTDLKNLAAHGWLIFDPKRGIKTNLQQKVEESLKPYDPPQEEIDQTVNHLIAQLNAE